MTSIFLTKSRHLEPFAAVLRANGTGVQRLLKRARLPVACLENPDTLVPAENMGYFRELAARTTGNPNISLDATRDIDFKFLGSFGRTLMTEPTLAGVLHRFRRFHATETTNVVIELHPLLDDDLWFGYRLGCQNDEGTWHTRLYVLSWMLQLVRLVDPAWLPAEITVDTTATPDRRNTLHKLGDNVLFRQKKAGFVVPRSMLALPISKKHRSTKGRDTEVWAAAPSPIYAESLKQILLSYANDGWLSIEQASEVTHISVRTLQRRLMEEQKSYSGLIQETRAERAASLLVETRLSIGEIARQLGYRNQANLTRAFYRWAKVSPSAFRKARTEAYMLHQNSI